MAKEVKWLDNNQIQVEVPKKPKKVTGTRFAALLGLNPWASEFETWCAITKTYEKPFEDTIYTKAGKTIEPKQAEYMKKSYGMTIVTPTDAFGEDYFNKTFGDFFPKEKILGGMWDFLALDENGTVDTVLEMKTTKRAEDWEDDIPEYYALQAALYAYLLKVDNVIMVASFLDDNDYLAPENFKPSIKNTVTVEFKVSERYPDMAQKVAYIKDWWKKYVKTGISPTYDEKRDSEILKALKTNTVSTSDDIDDVINEIETLQAELDAMSDKEKRLKDLKEVLKKAMLEEFKDGDTKVEVHSSNYTYSVSKSNRETIDKKRLKEDGLLEKYVTTSTTYTMTMKKEK